MIGLSLRQVKDREASLGRGAKVVEVSLDKVLDYFFCVKGTEKRRINMCPFRCLSGVPSEGRGHRLQIPPRCATSQDRHQCKEIFLFSFLRLLFLHFVSLTEGKEQKGRLLKGVLRGSCFPGFVAKLKPTQTRNFPPMAVPHSLLFSV